MVELDKLEYRMYGLVPYNLSPIQQGIQFGHALQEYNNNEKLRNQAFDTWRLKDKTFIILNGGTTNTNDSDIWYGSLNKHADYLNILLEGEIATFYEPDLGQQLTAVIFLVSEIVYDKIKYPEQSQDETLQQYIERLGYKNVALRNFLTNFKFA